MKHIGAITVALSLGASGSACCEAASEPPSAVTAEFYCDLTALTPEQRLRQRELAKILRPAAVRVREQPDGYEIEFPGEDPIYGALVEYLPLERKCCPFLDLTLRLERNGGKLYWTLGGPAGVKAFIREEMHWLLER